jgi:hypothetical protein
MLPAPSDSRFPPLPLPASGPPRRSPRTSLILAELARQRRLERRQRRLKRQQRRQAWAWLTALGRGPFEAMRSLAAGPAAVWPKADAGKAPQTWFGPRAGNFSRLEA